MDLSRGVALVTGASAGLGRELCRCFAQDKIGVIAVARRSDAIESLCRELQEEFGTENHAISADLTDEAGVRALVEEVQRRGLRVDYLVNNAGVGQQGRFDHSSVERELFVVDLNVRAVVHLCGAFIPPMVERGSGHVLNISSLAGFQAGPFMSSYYASKAFVTSFSEGLHYELRDGGVSVTVSCPGPIQTEFAQASGISASNLMNKTPVSAPETVARSAYRAMKAKRRLATVSWRDACLVRATAWGPRAWGIRIAGWLNRGDSS